MKRGKLVGLLSAGFICLFTAGSTVQAGNDRIYVSANTVQAASGVQQEPDEGYYINEIYRDIYSEEEIRAYFDSRARFWGEEESPYFNDYMELLDYVKNKMVERSPEFSFTVPMEMAYIQRDGLKRTVHNVVVRDSMEEKYSTSNKDGDYLDANYVATDWMNAEVYDYENNTATFTIRNIYTSTAEQEAQVDAMLPRVLESLELDGKSDYEKIKIIHDYIVNHITYTQNNDYECHSTYAALVKGEAVCQGYASLFYRMCKEIGIQSRYITGMVYEPHGWNIVELEGKWYNIDCQADDIGEGKVDYGCFLKAPVDFIYHTRYEQYTTEEFEANYPMSEISYEVCISKEIESTNQSCSFPAIAGNNILTDAEQKPKVLYFYDPQNGRSIKQLKDIAGSSWLSEGKYDVCAVDGKGNSKEAVAEFVNTYSLGNIPFGYTEGTDAVAAMQEYCNMASISYDEFFPYIVIIDSDNKVRQVVSGYYTAEELKAALDKINKTSAMPVIPEPEPSINDNPFKDVPANAWYADAVSWAVQNGITSGTGPNTFSPNADCTRGQIVTFLWRAAGSPVPRTASNPFADIDAGAYYYNAVLWAVENGITAGTSNNTFSPDMTCTRGQAVSFLYRYEGNPSVRTTRNPFGDVRSGTYYYKPVLWAVSEGVTSGTSETTFSPDANCSRSQIVTLLYRQAN